MKLEDVRTEIERRGIKVSWTMAVACREYQESLAVQRAAEKPSGTRLIADASSVHAPLRPALAG